MARHIRLSNLDDPRNLQQLEDFINFMADALDLSTQRVWPDVTTTDPNGNISGKKGQLLTFDNGSALVVKQNTTGSTVWRTVA